ncbi:MAG: chorismate synthase [Methanococcaceae archaeon]
MRFLTAGESHGKSLTVIVDSVPANLKLSKEFIDKELFRRQQGYGRGLRMKIETDQVEILSGIRYGKTLGSPIAMLIKNKDWENWLDVMAVEDIPSSRKKEKISVPRPGHADLTGSMKFNFDDLRNSIERSSARETAARVAAGAVCKRFLEEFGISIGSYVESLGSIHSKNPFSESLFSNRLPKGFRGADLSELSDKSDVRVLDSEQEEKIINRIKRAKKNGDTLGGTFFIAATGVPAGLGSFMQFDKKLNAAIASSIMSVHAVKGVEIGSGFLSSDKPGSEVHDEIILKDGVLSRASNRSGGIEGGISTGLPIIVRGAMKPIPTLMSPIGSVDLKTMKEIQSRRERSDFTAVPACAVIAESMLAFTLADFFLEKFGGDSIEEIKERYKLYNASLMKNLRRNFRK